MLTIHIDHKLRIARSELPPDAEQLIKEALTIPNMARQNMMEHRIFGWQHLPPTIQLWDEDSGELVLPRGFGFNLTDGLNSMGIEYQFSEWRNAPRASSNGKRIDLFDWQQKAVEMILMSQEGIWKAPAGSGKTVGVLEAIRRTGLRSIVIVNTKDIMWQWIERAKTFLGEDYPIGQIGDKIFVLSNCLNVATIQTLHSRYYDLLATGFFSGFGFMCLDECHHATAETYNKIVNRFSSVYRIGVSATPDKTGDFALARNVLGPIIHETHPNKVTTLMIPEVIKVPTNFSFPYRSARGNRPSNYGKMLQALVSDENRNRLISRVIMLEEGHHCLVVSKRLEHLRLLTDLIEDEYEFPIMWLTGKETSEERKKVVQVASESPSVIFSTLADEALDIPRLDRLFLVFPQRNSGLITQQVGRVERMIDLKRDAKIYDFCDLEIGPLENQWKVRRREVYNQRGYKVTLLKI